MRTVFRFRTPSIAVFLLFALSDAPASRERGPRNLPGPEVLSGFDGHYPLEAEARALEISKGEYVRIWLETPGRLFASISDPTGNIALAFQLGPTNGIPLSFVAECTGTYRLSLRSEGDSGVAPRHRVQIEAASSATKGGVQRVRTDRAFLASEQLAQRWQEQPRRDAVDAFGRVLLASRSIADPLLEARTLTRLGDLHRSLAEAPMALNYYRRAIELEQGIAVQIDATLGAALAHLRLDGRGEALKEARRALTLSRAFGDQRDEARALTTLGIAHYDSERFIDSLNLLEQALAIWQRVGDRRGQSWATLNAGFAYSELSKERLALEAHHTALELAREVGDKRLEALAQTAIGHSYSKIGKKQEALNAYYQASPILEAMGDPFWTASLYSGMGYVYDELGDKESAVAYYVRAAGINRRIASAVDEGANLVRLGRLLLSMDQPGKALANFQAGLSLFRKRGHIRLESVALTEIAKAYVALGREVEAMNHYTRAMALYKINGFRREEANALNSVGRLEERRGRAETARRHFRRALRLSREAQDRFAESQSLLNLARVARASDDLDHARAHAEEALDVTEQLRGNVASYSLRTSYFASIRELHEFYVDLLMELHAHRPLEGFDHLAFLASERARARSLVERLSEDPPEHHDLDPELLEHRAQIEKEIRATAARFHSTDSSTKLGKLLAELDRVRAVLKSQDPSDDPLRSDLVSIEELQNGLLDSSTLLLSYHLGSKRSFLFAVSKADLYVHFLPPRTQIETLANSIYRLLTDRERKDETSVQYHLRLRDAEREFWKAASGLSHMLLGPVQNAAQFKRLVVVGDGTLHHFPFSALPVPSDDQGAAPVPLIAEHEVLRLPSASTMVALKTRGLTRATPPKTVAILADPVFDGKDPRVEDSSSATPEPEPRLAETSSFGSNARDLIETLEVAQLGEGVAVPRLLASRQEARGILGNVPASDSMAAMGFDASRTLATSGALAEYQVVHFATHGVLNTEHPELSGIILSLVNEQGRPQDGFLRLHDIESLHLPVKLVVLSACSTGLGKTVRGEGIIGLVRGFMSAGADRVLASYWNVDDEATAELMKHFYRNLFTGGLPPQAALREAQRSMWQEKRWRSPFYWAAFELQGIWM